MRADPGQLEQVLMNLAVNARDAMPGGGRLTIETPGAADTRPTGRRRCFVAVTDTGCGMDAATRARIFEPFFTTKEPGKGTGLGLAVVHGIVTQSGRARRGGQRAGAGGRRSASTCRGWPGRPAAASAVGPADLPGGTETVLLVEDEPAVRALDRRVLANCGYTVLEAADGRDALRVAAEHAGPIDLLVTDVVMPRWAAGSWPSGSGDPARGCGCCS